MVKHRQVKSSKRQNESKVKIENQKENVHCQSFTHSGESNRKQSEEKQLYENKIIKEFLMKRKLLMKALKQKQKQKVPKLLTFQAFQNNEGFSSNHQNSSISLNHSNGRQFQKSQKISLDVSISQNQILQTQKLGNKANIAIQTKILKKKKSIKKIDPIIKNTDKYIFDCLIQNQKIKDDNLKQGSFSSSIKRAKSKKDLEKIKNQLISHFNKNNGQQIRKSKIKNFQNKQIFSESQTLSISYNNTSTVFKKLNDEIQNYYEAKSLKKIIMKQFKSKFNRKSTKGNKRIQFVKKVSDNHYKKSKSKSMKNEKSEKYQQLLFQIQDRQQKISTNKKYLDNQNKTRGKQSSRKIINERFKRVLDSDRHFNKNKNGHKEKRQKNRINKSQQDYQQFIDIQQIQDNFDPMEAWKSQFKSIQSMLLQKYGFLGKYLISDKKVDYKQIYKGIKKGGKEISDKLQSQNKSGYQSALSHSNISSYIDLKRTRRTEYQKIPKYSSKQTNKNMIKTKGKLLKQVKLDRNEQNQFGKSFDFNQEAEIANQQNFMFDDLNKSNVLSHIFNSSFYSQSLHKKSDTNSDEKKKSFNNSFFSQQRNTINEHLQTKSNNDSDTNKSVKQNEISMSKGSEGKQIFYMSEQIILDLKHNN